MTATLEQNPGIFDGESWIGGVPEYVFTIPSFQGIVRSRSGGELAVFVTPECVDIADAEDAARDYTQPHFVAEMLADRPGVMEFSVRTALMFGGAHPDLYAGRLLARTMTHFEETQPIQAVHARWLADSVNYEQYTDALEQLRGNSDLAMMRRLAARRTWTAGTLNRLGFRAMPSEVIEAETEKGEPMISALFEAVRKR